MPRPHRRPPATADRERQTRLPPFMPLHRDVTSLYRKLTRYGSPALAYRTLGWRVGGLRRASALFRSRILIPPATP